MIDFFQAAPQLRKDYADRGWALLKGALPVEVADATLYAFQRELGGDWESYKGDYIKTFLTNGRSFECYSFDHTPMSTLQWGLTPFVAAVAGKDLLPSHAYLRVYRRGDVCHIHSDAPDCQFALSIALGLANDIMWDFSICETYFDADAEKPVEAATRAQSLSLTQVPMSTGDAVLYNGYNYLHGRTNPNPNRWAAAIFCHWVERGGRHARHAFDGRAKEFVRRANFVFPDENAPEKLNPNRLPPSPSRGRGGA